MSEDKWAKTVANLQNELAHIESSCEEIGRHFGILQLEAESLKMDFLKYSLGKQKEAVARERGFTLLIKDRKKLGASLALTVGTSILGGLLAKNKDAALNAGLSGFNGVLQGFGETRWAISLQKGLVILPCNAIPAKGRWVTLESLIAVIGDLKTEALQGKRLGNLNNIIQRLQQSKGKLIYIPLPNSDSTI